MIIDKFVITYGVTEKRRRTARRSLESIIRSLAQTLQGIFGAIAANLFDDEIVVRLTMSDIAENKRRTRLHERSMEKAFTMATIRDHLERNRNGAGTFTPARIFCGEDSPAAIHRRETYMVTLPLSPPKVPIYVWIHRRAWRSR